MGKKALLIGIENYEASSGLRQVFYAEKDVTEMSSTLERLGYQVTKYINKESIDVEDKLFDFVRTINEEDQVIFYFAGHGECIMPDNKNMLIMYDGSIYIERIIEILSKYSCKKLLLILDCCHSGMLANGNARSSGSRRFIFPDEIIQLMNKSNYCITLSACGKNESSYPLDRYEHGAFTYNLLQCLNGSIKHILTKDNELAFTPLLDYLRNKVPEDVKSCNSSHEQHPCMYGNMESDFIIHRFSPSDFITNESKSFLSNIERIVDIELEDIDYGSIKSLSGFKKGSHQIFKTKTDDTEAFVKRIGDSDLQAIASSVSSEIVNSFEYSAAYNEADGDLGERVYEYPDFEYSCYLTQDDDVSQYVITQKVNSIENRELLFDELFNDVFHKSFKILKIKIHKYAYNQSGLLDNIRELLPKNADFTDDGNWAIINFSNIKVKLRNNTLVLIYREKQTPEDMINKLIELNSIFDNLLF